jgi:hypothetical protein
MTKPLSVISLFSELYYAIDTYLEEIEIRRVNREQFRNAIDYIGFI